MNIETIITGALEENCYVVTLKSKALIVDPGDDFQSIKKAYKDYDVIGILLTHRHFDHIGALLEVVQDTQAAIFENSNLKEKIYQVGPFQFQVIFTKGHTKDSVTYYFKEEKCMFVGDFIFQGSIGRMDLEGGDEEQMKESLHKIKQYPDDIVLYPGHGPRTSLKEEKQYNPYF